MTVIDDESSPSGSEPHLSARPANCGDLEPTDLTGRYGLVRGLTERLVEPLSPEDQTVQSMPDVSPTKWHRAHTSWFFETFVLGADPGYKEFDPTYRFLFNSYYEAVGARHARPERGFITRPGCAEIAQYREHVDQGIEAFVRGGTDDLSTALIVLGLHHEQQHQELLLMDIKHVLGVNPTSPAYADLAVAPPAPARPIGWIEHDGGMVEIGHDGPGFSFDNEGPRHETYLAPFSLADRLVTCGEWRNFIDDGGYRRPELWLSDGWAAVNANGWTAPLYWRCEDGSWRIFTLGGEREVDSGEPVSHVSYYEADAFARWAGARLPTEFEWETVASAVPGPARFLDLRRLHPSRQDHPSFLGDTWVWTSSAYLPYPRFKPAAGAVGEYNGKFMVNQHVLRGGSCVTPAGHARVTYRNFFPPAARWAFSGLRLASDPEDR
jgi:ergothioneine biosynthesis protein EgtB